MSGANDKDFDAELDLVLERVIDVPRELVWAAWTRPEHLERWFTPTPCCPASGPPRAPSSRL